MRLNRLESEFFFFSCRTDYVIGVEFFSSSLPVFLTSAFDKKRGKKNVRRKYYGIFYAGVWATVQT